jgi:hypothetical protein
VIANTFETNIKTCTQVDETMMLFVFPSRCLSCAARSTPNAIETNIITHRIDEPTEILLKDKASKQ